MDNVLFYFAGMPVYVYGFLVSLGLLFGAVSALSAGRRKGFGWCKMFDFILGTAIVFLVAGRLAVLLQEYGAAVLTKPWKIITEISDGVDLRIGLIFAVLYGLISAKLNGILGVELLDAITPGILWIRIFSSLGSQVFGKSTNLPWAVQLGEFRLHPLPLYSAVGYYLIRFVVKQIRWAQRFDGQVFIATVTLAVWLQWLLLFVSEGSKAFAFWLYPIIGLIAGAVWSFGHVNSPPRTKKTGAAYWVVQSIILVIVVCAMAWFFYSRFE
ncbi:MAG TPA: prolipoprotein diacylglyceryl transferase [Limnochordia bacterium]|nr:prolipoprotein diacylglyceryl transferase [Limnochordia bacterium]HQD69671.1 prolipoprotein diacylglyceryl transferase [Limnochordia bacterium]